MANELAKVCYETALGNVELDFETVKNYLVRGNKAVSDKEVFLFVKLCEAQKLNPFTNEVYLIKFGDDPAQIVVGHDTYKRRADENPNHLYYEHGIVVSRGTSGEVVRKDGACLYPTETLLGGWCKVHTMRNGAEVTTFREVAFSEYNKNQSRWKSSPCSMIEKVAVSQALREAYPRDYAGLYTEEETISSVPADVEDGDYSEAGDPIISQDDRKVLFGTAFQAFGKDAGAVVVKEIMAEEGFKSTTSMTRSAYERIMAKLSDRIASLEATDE